MVKKKYIAIGFLVFCLNATLLVSVTSSAEYDPWVDISGPNGESDGLVNVWDLGALSDAWLTEGNPTKNVNVTNWPVLMNVNVTNWPEGEGQPGTTRNETEKTVLLEYIVHDSPVHVAYTWHPAEFTFAFNPKQTFVNVTDMQIDVVFRPDISYNPHRFDIKFNDAVTISTGSVEIKQYYLISLVIPVENTDVYQAIYPGINTLAITNPCYYDGGTWISWFIDLYRVVLTIEYEYQP